jgi:hypothetical protein
VLANIFTFSIVCTRQFATSQLPARCKCGRHVAHRGHKGRWRDASSTPHQSNLGTSYIRLLTREMLTFRRHLRRWMISINMQLTPLRELFLRRYEALLVLRGVCPYLLGCRQAAMEVLLNLSRHPIRQQNYLRAMIRKIGMMITNTMVNVMVDQSSDWDVPGHIIGSGLRFSVIEDPLPAAAIVQANVDQDSGTNASAAASP